MTYLEIERQTVLAQMIELELAGRPVPVIMDAVEINDVDAAIAHVMAVAGIQDGDIAGFSMPNSACWLKLDAEQRTRAIFSWLHNEQLYVA